MENKILSHDFVHLVVLYTYRKMMHGAYNVKLRYFYFVSTQVNLSLEQVVTSVVHQPND